MGTWIDGWRMLAKNRDFTAVAVLTLALGIAANTAIFRIFDVLLLGRLPASEYLGIQNGVLSDICLTTTPERLAVSVEGAAELVPGQIVSGGYSSPLGLNAALGQTIRAEDDKIPREPSQRKRHKQGTWQQKTRNNR